MAGKTVARTSRSYSSSVEHEAARTTRDKEKKNRIEQRHVDGRSDAQVRSVPLVVTEAILTAR